MNDNNQNNQQPIDNTINSTNQFQNMNNQPQTMSQPMNVQQENNNSINPTNQFQNINNQTQIMSQPMNNQQPTNQPQMINQQIPNQNMYGQPIQNNNVMPINNEPKKNNNIILFIVIGIVIAGIVFIIHTNNSKKDKEDNITSTTTTTENTSSNDNKTTTTTKKTTTKTTTTKKNNQTSNKKNDTDWKESKVIINGNEIKLPILYSDFVKITGFESNDAEINNELKENYYELMNLHNSDKKIVFMVSIANLDNETKKAKDCYITRIDKDDYNADLSEVIFPKNLEVGMEITKEELIKLLGDPDDTYSYDGGDDYKTYTLKYKNSTLFYNYYEIKLLNNKKIIGINLSAMQ